MKIAITGTPCVGKTTIAKILARKLDYKYINLNDLAKKENAFVGFDRTMNSKIVDMKKLKIVEKIKQNCIIDGHFSHEFNVDLVIVVRCRPDILLKRLKKRYKNNNKKIKENLDAEILGVITSEVLTKKRKFFEVDNSNPKNQVIEEILGKIKSKRHQRIIDWVDYGFNPDPKFYFVKN